MSFVFGSGHITQSTVKGDQHAIFLQRKPEQISICDLLMAGDAGCEWRGEIYPTILDLPI